MGRRKDGRHRSYGRRTAGRERALEHIRDAKKLSRELGGTDKDVKQYFFSLSENQLQRVFEKYGKLYGDSARQYAETTFPKWKSGKVYMSGTVAERLFGLLPPTMPIEEKFRLVESLWKHVGPSSRKTYYIGSNVNLDDVQKCIKDHLEDVVVKYDIPASMEARFDWLAQGDVGMKQKLLNHYREQEKLLLSEALRNQLPVLMDHLNSEKGSFTTGLAQVLEVGKHEVRIEISERVNGISENRPVEPSLKRDFTWVWWVIGVAFLLWLLAR